jgi:glycerol-3-phosphate acyltransferase PlsY
MIVTAIVAFAVGSIPFGYVLVRLLGKGDIRATGSGNIGATNVGRLLGPTGWTSTLLLDAGKGVAGVVLGGWVTHGSPAGMAVGAAAAVLGHCYTPWLRFRGGKGVATMLGAFGWLSPGATLVAVVAFGLLALLGRWVSLASLGAAVALVAATVGLGQPSAYTYAAGVVCLVVFVRHRENIGRLFAGTESRIGAGSER